MKRKYIYGILILALTALPACNQVEPEEELGDLIRIGATITDATSTKGFINKADLQGTGTTVKIYDDLTGFTGTVDDTEYEEGDLTYIDDSMVWSSGVGETAVWNFASGNAWRWTRTGKHTFYGWLTKDKDNLTPASLVSGVSYDASSKVLTVPAITFTKTTTQFDFSYSDKVSVDLNSGISAPESVNLPLSHLFSGISFALKNKTTEGKYTIKSLAITGLRNNGSATLDYSEVKKVNYSTPVVGENLFVDNITDASIVLDHGYSYDILGTSATTVANDSFTPEFKLLWPLTAEQVQEIRLTGSYEIEGNVDEDGNQILTSFNVSLTEDGTTYVPWEAGHKYQYSLIFTDKAINLVYSVLPWDYIKTDLDFADHSISATALTLEGGTKSGNNYLVKTTADVINGSFQIWTPVGAIWRVSMKGDTEFFTLEDNQGTIDPSTDNGLVSFRIVPNTTVKAANPGTTAKITLHFSVETASGEELNGNTEINRDNIQIVY